MNKHIPFVLFQVSDWSAGGSEALPESPSYPVYGVQEYFTLLPLWLPRSDCHEDHKGFPVCSSDGSSSLPGGSLPLWSASPSSFKLIRAFFHHPHIQPS